jgi:hypothetical protein
VNGNDHRDNEQQNTPPPARPSEIATPPQDQPKEEPAAKKRRERKKWDWSDIRVFGLPLLDFLQTCFDGLLLLTAIVGGCFVNQQIELTQRQIADAQDAAIGQQRATNRALTVAENQAKSLETLSKATDKLAGATERGVIGAQDALRFDQRAWISPGVISIDHEPSTADMNAMTHCFKVRILANNAGKTAALKLRGFIHPILAESIPDEPPWDDATSWSDNMGILQRKVAREFHISPKFIAHTTTVFPGSTTQFFDSMPQCVAPAWIDDYKAHRKTLFVWAHFSYFDVFRRRHWLTLCAVHPFPDSLNPDVFGSCPYGNETDEHRQEKPENHLK